MIRVAFEPPPGLNSDDTTFAADGIYATASNIRWKDGRPQTIGSWQTAIGEALAGVCRNVLAWTTVAAGLTYAFGEHNALEVYVSGALADITPAALSDGNIDSAGSAPGYGTGGYGDGTYSTPDSAFYARTWSLDTWGENLVAVPRGDTLYLWENDPGTEAAAVTNAPDEIAVMLVTPERQVLALGCSEEGSGDFNPLCIRGCDIEDITDWTTTSTNNAFEHILEGGGQITAGRLVGPYVAVWTDNSLYLGQFLGNPGQAYRFDRVETNCGAIGPNSVQVYKGVAYWVGPDKQFRAWAPGGKPFILPCQIRNDFADNIDLAQAVKVVAASISQFDEIWFHYPDSRDYPGVSAENSRYVMVNVAGDSPLWSQGLMERTAFIDAGVVGYPVGVAADGMVYHHEIGSEDVEWRIAASGQYIDEAEYVYQITGIRPDFESQGGDVGLSITTRMTPQGSTIATKNITLSAGEDKEDFRITGRIMELEWSGNQFARFGKPTFSALQKGRK